MRRLTPLLTSLLALSCDGDGSSPQDSDTDVAPVSAANVIACPGSADCAVSDDRTLRVGAAVVSIIPACWESWVDADGNHLYNSSVDDFLDCGCDRLCPGDEGYTAADEGEGDGVWRPVWIAGYDSARAAMGMRDPAWGLVGEADGLDARVVVFDQGHTRVALVTLDGMGWMYDDVLRMREAVAARSLDVDHVIAHTSHSHDSPDSMGQYGRVLTESGYDPDYAAQVHVAVADAVEAAVAGLTEVTMTYGQVDANDYAENGVANLISDTRDPWIVDPRVGALKFVDGGGATVASVVHFANHPESMGADTNFMSAGFPAATRHVMESGVQWDEETGRAGIGGVSLYVNGTVGGMMTSLRATVVDPLGVSRRDNTFEKEDSVGMMLGEMGLDALEAGTVAVDPELRVAARSLYLPVDNIGFQAMFQLGVFGHRPAYNYDPDVPIGDDNPADILSEVTILQLGPVRMITAPGEVLPEGVIGGYDGKYLPPGGTLTKEDNTNPPDLTKAPAGPYFLDELGGELNWVIGLGNDQVGYIIPPYDFILGPAEYLSEAEGHHYEETNSLGARTLPLYLDNATLLRQFLDGEVE